MSSVLFISNLTRYSHFFVNVYVCICVREAFQHICDDSYRERFSNSAHWCCFFWLSYTVLQTQARVNSRKAHFCRFNYRMCALWAIFGDYFEKNEFIRCYLSSIVDFVLHLKMGRKGLFAEKPKKGPGRKAKKQGPPVLSRQFKGKSWNAINLVGIK